MIRKLTSLFSRKNTGAVPEPLGETLLFNAYCTKVLVPKPLFPHKLQGRRDLSDPELLEHLGGFCGFVFTRGDGQMTQDKFHVILHLQRVQHHITMRVAPADLPAFQAWALEANAIVFTQDGNIVDPQGRVLIGALDGKAEPMAQLPYPAQALARKAATEAQLKARGIEVADTLPPVVCEDELLLRDKNEVVERARALLVTALRAESVASGEPMATEALLDKMPLAEDGLSPLERAFLGLAAPTQEQCAQFIWGYESLYLLEWALGLAKELPYPSQACDAASTVATLIEMRGPELRVPSELLDALDLHYRLHWAIRQKRLKKQADMPGIDADVVMQRHHALNWLVRYQHAPWDDVDTPT
jgi:hypothetical protein